MVVRCRKEELRYDGRCPCSRCGDEPCTERHWLLLLGPSTSPALRNMQSGSQCSQQVVDKSFKIDNQSKLSKESFSRSKLCRLALAGVLPHEAGIILYICSPKCLKFGSSHRGKRRIFLFINSTLISCECKGIYPWIAGLKGFLTVCG